MTNDIDIRLIIFIKVKLNYYSKEYNRLFENLSFIKFYKPKLELLGIIY